MALESHPVLTRLDRSKIWSAPSYRRFLLDALLKAHAARMRGVIVDLGGKRTQRRGTFVPPTEGVDRWIVVNIATEVEPDIVADIAAVPLQDSCADVVLCCETLEHLPHPMKAVSEAARLLKPGGIFIGSCPFLFPVHGDPSDFNRWTAQGLRQLFAGAALSVFGMYAMGATLGTLGMLLELSLLQNGGTKVRRANVLLRIFAKGIHILARVAAWCELRYFDRAEVLNEGNKFTTGYFFVASKSGGN